MKIYHVIGVKVHEGSYVLLSTTDKNIGLFCFNELESLKREGISPYANYDFFEVASRELYQDVNRVLKDIEENNLETIPSY